MKPFSLGRREFCTKLFVFPDTAVIRSRYRNGEVQIRRNRVHCHMEPHGVVDQVMQQGAAFKMVKEQGDEQIDRGVSGHDKPGSQAYGIDLDIHYNQKDP